MESKYFIRTFGCQMNKHDSELISGTLSSNGFFETNKIEDADIIIFNTCSVREKAEDRVFKQLDILKKMKKNNPEKIIGISGCIPQRCPEDIMMRAPHVNLIFGPGYIYELPYMIKELKNGEPIVVKVGFKGGQKLETDIENRKRVREFSAWIAIMRGCDNYCSYCIVPYVRGREWSRSAKDILKEARKLVDEGVIEFTLLGQNVNSYRDGDFDFPELLRNVNNIPGLERIRFVTSHPKDFSEKLVDVIADCEKVCEHINLPVQSGSDRILKMMNRKYSTGDYLSKVEYLKKKVPDVSITTDMIVGFPGEEEKDFNGTLDLIRKVEYDGIFGFVYSPRPGTKAEELNDDVPHEIKIERLQKLIQLQRTYSLRNNEKMLGRSVEVLIEKRSKKDPKMICGRTRTNKVVNFKGDLSLRGKLLNVKITDFGPNSLIGVLED